MTGADIQSDPEAMSIYQAHLDALTRDLLAGDFNAFSGRFAYPHTVLTANNCFEINSVEDHRHHFFGFLENLRAEGVTDLIRIVQEAWFVSETEIRGTHVSHKMRDANRIMAPYHNRLRLVRDKDNRWRETHSANAIRNKAGKFGIVESANMSTAPDLNLPSERTSE